MPRKDQGWITFQSSSEERQILEAYCQGTQRSKTEVLRELVRSLESPEFAAIDAADLTESAVPETSPDALAPLQVSARNLLRGQITNLSQDGVNTEVTLEIAPKVVITSVITTASAQRLGLQVGKIAYAMIKSSNVMIAVSSSPEQAAERLLT